MMIASIRYLDEFVKQDGQWLFAERRLMVNWTETRPSTAVTISREGWTPDRSTDPARSAPIFNMPNGCGGQLPNYLSAALAA